MDSGMRIKIRHLTEFHYARPVAGGRMKIRMTPRSGNGQELLRRELRLEGCSVTSSFLDVFGNPVELVEVESGRSSVVLEANSEVETLDLAGLCPIGPHHFPRSGVPGDDSDDRARRGNWPDRGQVRR